MRGAIGFVILALFVTDASRASDYVPDQIICKVAKGYTADDVNAWLGTVTLEWIPDSRLYLLGTTGVTDPEGYAEEMEASVLVESADPNYYAYSPEAVRQMPLAVVGGTAADHEDQEASKRIDLASAHARALGKGVTVAVIDTGVDIAHPQIEKQLLVGFDFVDTDHDASEEASGVDEDGDGEIDGGFGHGTMVAGIVSLVAPAANILPVRVLDDEGIGTAWDAIEGVRYATDSSVDVMNLSFGTPAEVPLLGDEIQRASDQGVIIVAAAGNQSTNTSPFFPAAHANALMITALDSLDVKADFADWHEAVDMSAPGTGILSTYPGAGWALGTGCSFAAPFVAGTAALVLSTMPRASRPLAIDRVLDAFDDVYMLPGNAPYLGQLGSGRINAGAALAVVAVEPPPVVAGDMFISPNPTQGLVHIELRADVASREARLDLYDLGGRLVRSLSASGRSVTWDGADASGRRVGSGVYYLRLTDGARVLDSTVHVLR